MIRWFINVLRKFSYKYNGGLVITSIILVIFSYLFQPIDFSKVRYLKGYVSSITPDLVNPVGGRYGRAGFDQVFNLKIHGIKEPFYINRYDGDVEKYGISNIRGKKVTIGYYNYYSSSSMENYTYVSILKIGSHTIYSEKSFVSTKVFWMVLGLTIFSCFMLVWGVWQQLKKDFSN